jgi:cytochrome c-type biogenesis protein CcmF
MIALVGNIFLITALVATLLGLYKKQSNKIIHIVFLSLSAGFLTLIYAYLVNDFSIKNVYENSHSLTPFIYKVSGTWGNHEGSLLLYIWMLSLVTIAFSLLSKFSAKTEVIRVQFFILSLFLLYLIFASNPFLILFPTPIEGLDLNPLLQDVGIAMHPPMLYLGYTLSSLCYSFAIVGLRGKIPINKEWSFSLRNWVLASFAVLSLGVGLGSWWAYRELGWGGYWFWDPVENSSLMPWLIMAGLIHLLKLVSVKNEGGNLVLVVSVFAFLASILGFFLVRSGVLSSVHSFASDPFRGIIMLLILFTLTLFALSLLKKRAGNNTNAKALFFTKEGGITFSIILWLILALTLFTGLVYPIISEMVFKRAISIGQDFYNLIFHPIFLSITFSAGLFLFFGWKADSNKKELLKVRRRLFFILAVSACLTKLIQYETGETSPKFLIAYFISFTLIITILWKFTEKYLQHKSFLKIAPHSYATYLSHIGIGFLIFSITFIESNKSNTELLMKRGDKISFANFDISFEKEQLIKQNNYIARIAEVKVWRNGKELATLKPETRVFLANLQKTSEASIYHHYLNDLYIVIGDKNADKIAVKIFHEPLINLLWLSVLIIFLGSGIGAITKR